MAAAAMLEGHGVHVNISEGSRESWRMTHRYGAGLEVDLDRPAVIGHKSSRVQLPEASLRGIRQLMECLKQPNAVAVRKGAPVQESTLTPLLVEQLAGRIEERVLGDITAVLERRSQDAAKTQGQDWETSSQNSEGLAQAQKNRALDISICCVAPASKVTVVFSKLPAGSFCSFCALLVCGDAHLDVARDLARALATAFMDPAVVEVATGSDDPTAVVDAVRRHFKEITIVPTVYMEDPENVDLQLDDALVDNIEKAIRTSQPRGSQGATGSDVKKLHHAPSMQSGLPHAHCAVSVSHLPPAYSAWCDVALLHFGLDFNLQNPQAKPRMPHVSAYDLSEIRRLLMPAAVCLDVKDADLEGVISVATKQLVFVGLPRSAQSFVGEALMTCFGRQSESVNASDGPAVAQRLELLESLGTQSCHVLAMSSSALMHDQALGVFLRLSTPGSFRLPVTPNKSPTMLVILVSSVSAWTDLHMLGTSLASLVSDDDLMQRLMSASDTNAFVEAVDWKLNNMKVMAEGVGQDTMAKALLHINDEKAHDHYVGPKRTHWSENVRRMIGLAQKYSLPLLTGVCLALVWSNVDMHSYHMVTHEPMWSGAQFLGHPISLHFVVNDMFMCLFFGLAIMEVTEAVLPGGGLYPMKRAASPLFATIGGVVGPAACYAGMVILLYSLGIFDDDMCEAHLTQEDLLRRLESSGHGSGSSGGSSSPVAQEPCSLAIILHGWGVPTATDISLAWMFARLIFGNGHPAVNFLLVLAIVDDAIGMVIIAVVYGDPEKPVQPQWLLLIVGGVLVAFLLRKLRFPPWQAYLVFAAPLSWLGLLKAHVHPALALVPIIPLMPATHRDDHDEEDKMAHTNSIMASAAKLFHKFHQADAPLHGFAHALQLPVDFGMFFFGLANAGVKLDSMGGLSVAVVVALIVGKTLGIACFTLLGRCVGFPLPPGMSVGDLFTMASLGSIGLTVALFMSNSAFVDAGLRGQAKFGAVLSVGAVLVTLVLRKLTVPRTRRRGDSEVSTVDEAAAADGEDQEDAVDEVIRVMILQRQYRKRGVDVDIEDFEALSRVVSTEDAFTDLARGTSTRSKVSSGTVRGVSTRSKRRPPVNQLTE